jgi:hypothetical protein
MLSDKDFVIQGGVRNYLGETEEVKAPKYWKSSATSPSTELAYITNAEKDLLLEANLHDSLKNGEPNVGASGIISLDGFGSTDPGQNRSGGDIGGGMDSGRDDGNDNFGSSTGGGASFNTPDPAADPTTPEYIEEEKTDYVTLPEKKLKLSKGVRPEMTVTLEQKKYYDRLDAQVDKVVKSPGYQIEKRLVNFALDQIPIIGMFLPEYYPKRTIAGDTVGSQDIPMDRPEQRSDYKSASSMLGSTDYLLGNIINTDLINDAIPDVFNNLPDSMVNKYFDGTTDGAFSESYNEIKSRLENQISTSQNGKVHKDNIFYDYLEKEGLING